MAYDPYKVRLTALEEKHDRLREQVIFNQDLQTKILTELKITNAYLSSMADYRVTPEEIEEEPQGDFS